MLGRLRMTVSDCNDEYMKLGEEVFGRPRTFTTLRFLISNRHKFKTAKMTQVCKDVCQRRSEWLESNYAGKISFPLGRGLCKT